MEVVRRYDYFLVYGKYNSLTNMRNCIPTYKSKIRYKITTKNPAKILFVHYGLIGLRKNAIINQWTEEILPTFEGLGDNLYGNDPRTNQKTTSLCFEGKDIENVEVAVK